jgi:hypothetical protein
LLVIPIQLRKEIGDSPFDQLVLGNTPPRRSSFQRLQCRDGEPDGLNSARLLRDPGSCHMASLLHWWSLRAFTRAECVFVQVPI